MPTGCYTCHARKVRCEFVEKGAPCKNCERLQEECLWSGPLPEADEERDPNHYTKAGTKRRRIATSCNQCRKGKRRCDGSQPCSRCLKTGHHCSYAPPSSESGIRQFALAKGCVRFPKPATFKRLTDAFFTHISRCRLLGFIHRETFLARLEQGFGMRDDELAQVLAMLAVASKHDYNDPSWEDGNVWARDALALIVASFNEVSLTRLMAVILLYEHDTRVGRASACFLLSGLAVRYVQILQLNVEYQGELSSVERESRRRLLWCCYFFDSTISSGVSQLKLLAEETIRIQLPMSDDEFARGGEGIPLRLARTLESEEVPPETGFQAHLLRLLWFRSRVLSYVKRFDKDEPQWHATSEFARLASAIHAWFALLPSEYSLIEPLDERVTKAQSPPLNGVLLIHTLYHWSFCDLYRLVLPGLSYAMVPEVDALIRGAPVEFIRRGQAVCFDHACKLSALFETALKHEADLALIDPFFTVAAYEASRVKVLYLRATYGSITSALFAETSRLLQIDVDYLRRMSVKFPPVKSTLEKTEVFVRRNLSSEGYQEEGPPLGAIDKELHPFAEFRQARAAVSQEESHLSSEKVVPFAPSYFHSEEELNYIFSADLASGLESWLFSNQFGS
ncbi:hypothetical protein TRVA0_008S02916 [Trichomonascus vanleenenianus]|uniref:Zn(II)2Cys6 transcription factor n=1 Tax=Trichomonascus vanleenenianus TaxID=2268995 RepID=UPI003ECB1BE7